MLLNPIKTSSNLLTIRGSTYATQHQIHRAPNTRQEMSQQQIQAPPGSGHLAVFQRSERALETAGDAFSLDSSRKRAKLHNSTDVTRLSDTVTTLLNAQNTTNRIEINFTQNTAKLSSMGTPCAYSILKENQIRPNFSEQSLLPSSAWQSPRVFTSPSDANLQFDANATTWVSGGSIYEQSSLLIADCASPSLPVQAIGPNQPSLLIKPHTSLTAAPYNVATYPIVSSGPQSQMIFFVSQPEPYTQEYHSAYGTTTVGLYTNHE